MRPTRRVPFDKLIELFIKVSDTDYTLDPYLGEGSFRVFQLENGLQVRVWDCTFFVGFEFFSVADIANNYFTVAYFLEAGDLQFADGQDAYRKHPFRDNLFLPASADCRMYVEPGARIHCLGISFSRNWLYNVLKDSTVLEKVKQRISSFHRLSLHGTMSFSERALVEELINSPWSKQLGSFYIKSTVLKMVSDFFCRLQDRDCFQNIRQPNTGAMLKGIEEFLVCHITGPRPNLKALAQTFSISEPTLKRLFKKRYSVNMTTYFLQKKMEYARYLMQENSLDLKEVANIIGYRNSHHFLRMFHRYRVSALSALVWELMAIC